MSSNHRDLALDALLHPFQQQLLQWQPSTLFLRARPSSALPAGIQATQPFAPAASALQRVGTALLDEDALPAAAFPLILVLPPRQREEARALFAKAHAALAPGGIVVAAVANDEGAKSREADLKQLAGSVTTLSKYHCRVFWTQPHAVWNAELGAQWQGLDAPRRVVTDDAANGHFMSRPGVFAWDRVDAASKMLVAALPANLTGAVADFGAGWGYLAQQVLARCPKVTSLDLYEADARALALAQHNLALAQVTVRTHWHDVTAGVDGRFDAIVCNPPFHALGGGERPDIGRAFIAAAAQALKPKGVLWLVANRHLPYEDALATGFAQVSCVAQGGGFKIVQAVKA